MKWRDEVLNSVRQEDLAGGMLIPSLHQHLFIQQIHVELLLWPGGVVGAKDMAVNTTAPALQGAYCQVEEMEESKQK